ncbi:hypothetical protein HGRIS_010834 [Hohenbuehelia grisea]|uniref:Protein CPL1-like domain-containing protein n=1 Tax=Hohenbuehelia grisea TaxID=104357 RepID=A0ABR3IYA2_9AGAR
MQPSIPRPLYAVILIASSALGATPPAASLCRSGETQCNLRGVIRGGPRPTLECFDTQNDVNSCGGCLSSHFAPAADSSSPGKDCATIEGAAQTTCIRGACVIEQCRTGYKLTSSRCEAEYHSSGFLLQGRGIAWPDGL